MSQLFIIFLLTLMFAAAFFVYLFNYLWMRCKHDDRKSQSHTGDLRELAKLLENSSPNTAKLVIEQLASRRLKGRDAPDIIALRMQAFLKMKEFYNALNCALQLTQLGRSSRFITETELIEHLAGIYSALGDNQKSYNEYLVLHQKRPENVEDLYNAASQVVEMKQYETAISLFQKILQQHSDHHPSLCKLGRIYYEKNLFSQALDCLNRAYSGNYDSNELRCYLALTLMQISGKDMVILALLNRVAQDPVWAEQALPHLARISAKLNNHPKVIAAVERYCELFGKEDSQLDELWMLQAYAYRQMHEMNKACNTWDKITPESNFYEEASQHILLFKDFTKEGIFYDYLFLKPLEFANLCTKIGNFILKAKGSRKDSILEGSTLKIISNKALEDDNSRSLLPIGAIIMQHFHERWDSYSGKQNSAPPNFHIYLRLAQSFTDADLLYNLQEMGINQNYDRTVNIHIYAFHYVSMATFTYRVNYNIYVHQPDELRECMLEFQRGSLGLTKYPQVEEAAGPLAPGNTPTMILDTTTTDMVSGTMPGAASSTQLDERRHDN